MSERFDGPLVITYDNNASRILGGEYWRVLKSFRYYLTANEWVFIPSGMLTDLGSVPPSLRCFVSEQGNAAQAYVVHDQLCEYLSTTFDGRPKLITRQEADLILKMALLDSGVNKTTAYLTYTAVAAYQMAMQIKDPTTTAIKRRLEADANFEDLK